LNENVADLDNEIFKLYGKYYSLEKFNKYLDILIEVYIYIALHILYERKTKRISSTCCVK
jgi:hypothetical protein